NFKEGIHFLSNYEVKEEGCLLPVRCVVYTRAGLVQMAYHIRCGYSRQLCNWAEGIITGKPVRNSMVKALPSRRNHNRLTSERLIHLLALANRIDDAALRNEIVEQLTGRC
ncbi:MAG: hypothetical protein LBU42_07970, partial [Prevotellaceae bacterium]|nr:hypothetical protein [Prevotellaceae bacterium]